MLSALQSAVFNRALELRAASGDLAQVRGGDVLQKTDSGGLFVTTDPAVDQPRVDRGEVIPTGPLPGGREIEPPPDTPSRAIDDEAIASVGATREDFSRAGRELPGARRAVLLKAGDPTLELPTTPTAPSASGSLCPPAATPPSSSTRSVAVRDPRRVPLPARTPPRQARLRPRVL